MPVLYAAPTPNGSKPLLMLHELGLHFELVKVNLSKSEQRTPEFLAMNPNGRIPVYLDEDHGEAIFESAAILQFLAEKHGAFLPEAPRDRFRTLSWLYFQMSAVGPMFGQAWHFRNVVKDNPYGAERYGTEARRIYGVLEARLGESAFLGGDAYSIADMATFPWTKDPTPFGLDPADLPNHTRWCAEISARPATVAALAAFG